MTELSLVEKLIPDGQSGVEWANTSSLARVDFFLVSQEIYALEEQFSLGHDVTFPRAMTWARRFEYPWTLLNSELDDQDVVLDAGGGESSMTAYIASKIKGGPLNSDEGLKVPPQMHNLDLFDWRDGILNEQKALKKKANWPWYYPRQGDLRWPPYPVETFDRIFCISVIEHLPSKDRIPAVRTLVSLLKPNGILLLTIDLHKDQTKGFTMKQAETLGIVLGLKIPPKPSDILRSTTTDIGREIAKAYGEKLDDPTEVLCFKVVKSRVEASAGSKK